MLENLRTVGRPLETTTTAYLLAEFEQRGQELCFLHRRRSLYVLGSYCKILTIYTTRLQIILVSYSQKTHSMIVAPALF